MVKNGYSGKEKDILEMVNFPAIYIANGTAILLLIVILLSLKSPIRHGLFEEKIFYTMIILNIMQCFIETAGFIMDGKIGYGYRTLTIVLNTILFINSTIFAYLWVVYVDFKLFTDMKRIKRIYPFVAIPAMLTIIGCLVNLITPVYFLIDEYNVYQRAGLYIIPYAVTYFYIAYGVILIYSYRKKVLKYLFFPALVFITPIMLGTLLQFFFYGYSLMWLGVAIGMVSLFVSFQNEASYIDVLSGLYNRQYLNNTLLMHSKKGDTPYTLAGIMLDIDGFKSINDKFGHLVGDEAILIAGKILRTAVGNQGTIFRCGGDEFVILMQINSQKEIIDMIDIIKTQTTLFNESEKKPYKIHFSIGYSTYESKLDSVDNFLRKIDVSMYEDKKRKIYEGILPDRRDVLNKHS
ncbi:MAG: GGDEF domain-containing protein [Clostridiaceae bacterium]|nr:GGDEF domain-containing protein [Clostridiaceae bacterium]